MKNKDKLYLIILIHTIVILSAGCTPQNQEVPPAETTPKKESSREMEREEDVPTLAKINTLPAGTVLDTADLDYEEIQKCFYSEELTEETIARIQNNSYKENDLIALDDLRYLRVLHMGFDGQTHVGELIVNQLIAEEILDIMKTLYEQQYPIEKMVLIDEYEAEDEASMSDNNTSAFNYRLISGTNRLSKHGEGLAIDINPRYNPCVRTGNGITTVEPQNGVEYADRTKEFSYKITSEDICCQVFKEHGFTWGGDWKSLKDYQHFEWGE